MKVFDTFKEYQRTARETAVYMGTMKVVYPALGLAGEAGEVCNKVKKIFRDNGGQVTDEIREALKKELGDVLWYLANLAWDLDIPLSDIAAANLATIADRKKRGTIHGSGDNR